MEVQNRRYEWLHFALMIVVESIWKGRRANNVVDVFQLSKKLAQEGIQ